MNIWRIALVRHFALLAVLGACSMTSAAFVPTAAAGDAFVRLKLVEPKGAMYFVRLGGYIHKVPWYLPRAVIPDGADKDTAKRLAVGQFTQWFDLSAYARPQLHDRMHRAGGVAEFPNVTADFICEPDAERRTVIIELATEPSEQKVVKRWTESYAGSLTSFLVSPNLAADADSLETASEMTARRLRWAREASGGTRHSPQQLIVQTSFWGPQRAELNLKEAEVLHLLGFNVVGNQPPEVREKFGFHVPGHTHSVRFDPAATQDEIAQLMEGHAARQKEPIAAGVPFGLTDEICARPPIGENPQAMTHFHRWLAKQKIAPRELGVSKLEEVVPIETPIVLSERMKIDESSARRVFYYTSRFRQHPATERIRWHNEAFHKYFPAGPLTSTLLADHPYFSGTGLGMGMTPNPTWGNYPLACDWFDLPRQRAVDLIGIEDWMGLQYMYGPNTTWEGFQLMGFQGAILRSGGRGQVPIIAWITPSDEINLRLKSSSALCQGAKHFFYWTYGPTATSTENYWSDLRGAYDGIVHMTRQLAAAEPIIAPGEMPKTRIALLYSISSDLWQPFGYVHMLARRGTYLSQVHDNYLVDMLTEEDIATGRLTDYDALYVTDPCIASSAVEKIATWVRGGGFICGSTAAGSRNEFGEPSAGLAAVFGIEPAIEVVVQPGRYHIRGGLNAMSYLDEIQLRKDDVENGEFSFGALGVKVSIKPASARVVGTFSDGSPAVIENQFGKGRARYVATSPALTYIKEANFVPGELKEKWPAAHRRFINATARHAGVPRVVALSHPVVEAGVYYSTRGTALVLANFTYERIERLRVRLKVPKTVKSLRSLENGVCSFNEETGPDGRVVSFDIPLGLNDIVLLE